jgi:hypothetical protein
MPELCDHDRYLQSDWQAREDASDPDAPDWWDLPRCAACRAPIDREEPGNGIDADGDTHCPDCAAAWDDTPTERTSP